MADAKLIDGKAFALSLRQRVGAGVADLVGKGGPKPGLATVLVGADPASKLGLSRASDSVVIFHTKFFTDNPVTISGRGAGQEVTASGVLGDLVSLSRVM